MDFDPSRAAVTPRDAATVILLRARASDGAAEVFLLRRHRGASFMAQAFVFPGGARDGAEDLRRTAARELFEEAGVLLSSTPVLPRQIEPLRVRQAAGADLDALLKEAGLALDLEPLVPFSHWVTPSAEKKRFAARFYACELPPGQTPRFDAQETVEELWITPREALARDSLLLPPPQLRTLWEIADPAERGPAAVLEAARARAPHIRPTIPRFAALPRAPGGFALLAPWDPEYATLGQGEGEPWPPAHPHGGGPSRFVLDGGVWRQL